MQVLVLNWSASSKERLGTHRLNDAMEAAIKAC